MLDHAADYTRGALCFLVDMGESAITLTKVPRSRIRFLLLNVQKSRDIFDVSAKFHVANFEGKKGYIKKKCLYLKNTVNFLKTVKIKP